jgi:hypothetical protein
LIVRAAATARAHSERMEGALNIATAPVKTLAMAGAAKPQRCKVRMPVAAASSDSCIVRDSWRCRGGAALQVQLERVLGSTDPRLLTACTPLGLVAYAAGSIVVVYDVANNKQVRSACVVVLSPSHACRCEAVKTLCWSPVASVTS